VSGDDGEWVLTPVEVSALGYLHAGVEDTRGRVRCGADGCGELWPCVTLRLVRWWMDAYGDG
jgi:hypothetical protein